MDRDTVMAAVHLRFAAGEAELPNGFAEHAPMGAEAMLTLGVDPAAVHAWAERHEPVSLRPGSSLAVARAAVVAELETEDWQSVLRRRATPLAAHAGAHLFHGLIRTAHAARALDARDEPGARGELATGLAAWDVWAGSAGRAADADIAPNGDPLADVLEFARRGAAAFVAAPTIFTLHAVTGPMAYLLVAEHLDEAAHVAAVAAFARTHAAHEAPPRRTDTRTPPTADALAALTQRWDAHPAKLVEAALRGSAATGDAAFLDAAAAMMA